MGTTLDALNAGSVTYKYVVAIEGYSWLLTNATPIAAVAAWAGSDWTRALDGVFVEVDNQSAAHPWEPLQAGGTCTLRVVPDTGGGDTFGVDTHCSFAGGSTYLAATASRVDTTITVRDTSAFPTSGEAFLGTECFAYASKTATTFESCTRGMYAPFQTRTGARWAEHHRQGLAANSVSMDPVVSTLPRVWLGRWVGVWLHRDVGGVLDPRAQAQLVYAGRITDLRDDGTGLTVVQLRHVLDSASEAVIGREQYTAKVFQGLYLHATDYLTMADQSPTGVGRSANDLHVLPIGPYGPNVIPSGYYTLEEVCNVITRWLTAETAAGRLWGTYSMASPVPSPDGLRSKIYYTIPGTAPSSGTQAAWRMRMPVLLAKLLGYVDEQPGLDDDQRVTLGGPNLLPNKRGIWQSKAPPYRAIITHQASNPFDVRFAVYDEVGGFVDQRAMVSAERAPWVAQRPDLPWGIFSINNGGYFLAAKAGAELRFMLPLPELQPSTGGNATWGMGTGLFAALTVSIDQTSDIVIKQVVSWETTFGVMLRRLFYGSGSAGYNSPTDDVMGFGLGIGIPGSLLGPAFDASIDQLPAFDAPIVLNVDKSSKVTDLISSDLILRWAFLRWRQGTLSFATWTTPTPAGAIAELTERNKARPAGTQIEERPPTVLTEEWQRNIITLRYNRESFASDSFASQLTLEDAVAVDDSGGEGKTMTILARNTYSSYAATGQALEQLAAGFLAGMPLFSRPFRKATRSIAPALFEQLAAGDIVLVSDEFARDPATGRRGITTRAALVTRVRANRGGAAPGNPRGVAPQGEVDIMFGPDEARFAPYSYSAYVDHTANSGNFESGYDDAAQRLRCVPHRDSASTELRDAARFSDGDLIQIIEVDPASWSAARSWSRTVVGAPVNDDIEINAPLENFDPTARYRIVFGSFGDINPSQREVVAQADSVTGRIAEIAAPFQYTAAMSTATTSGAAEPVELVPDDAYGDGAPLDVGHEVALADLANMLVDRGTARHAPVLFSVAVVTTTSVPPPGNPYCLLAYWPVFLTRERATSAARRTIAVAPMFRSTSGSTASLRVTLTDAPPTATGIYDVPRPNLRSEAVFATASTTFTTAPPQYLDGSVKRDGIAWVWLEGGYPVETWGLATFDEGARS